MNRDSTIIQAAILMIAIAILGIAIWRQQSSSSVVDTKTSTTVVVGLSGAIHTGALLTGDTTPRKIIVENSDEDKANLVKQYFRYLQAKDFKNACLLMSPAKCAANRQAAIDAFSTEFLKYTNGYEYVSVKDFNLKSPSGKSVVCVKYSYRLNNDPNP